jgi:hypothetical protein
MSAYWPIAIMFYICSLEKTTARGLAMDNRVNKIRNKISSLRLDMWDTERAMRSDIGTGVDCVAAATRLMLQRAELVVLVGERRKLGDRTPIGLLEQPKARPLRRGPAADIVPVRNGKVGSARA